VVGKLRKGAAQAALVANIMSVLIIISTTRGTHRFNLHLPFPAFCGSLIEVAVLLALWNAQEKVLDGLRVRGGRHVWRGGVRSIGTGKRGHEGIGGLDHRSDS